MEERRRVSRHHVSWAGKCTVVDGDVVDGWIECQVIDISPLGVGLEVYSTSPGAFANRRIVVELQAPAGTSVTLTLAGEVRDVVPRPQGGLRVGVELTDVSDANRSFLQALLEIAR